jgi:hypothetical protein
MSPKRKIAAVIAVIIAPALGSPQALLEARAQAPQQWRGNTISSAHAAASKSSRVARPGQRSRAPKPADASADRILSPDGRDMGTDPDAAIRFQLRRDNSNNRM